MALRGNSAGFLSSMLTLFAMIATPLFGLWVDRVGKRALLMMFGSMLLIPVYLMMGYTQVNLYVPMAMMGVAFSLIPAVMWPSVAYIVDQSKLGTAYGLMTMIQNIGLFGLNLLVGWANEYGHADASNPGGISAGHVDFLNSGDLGGVVCVPAAAAGDGAAWAWVGDDYYGQEVRLGGLKHTVKRPKAQPPRRQGYTKVCPDTNRADARKAVCDKGTDFRRSRSVGSGLGLKFKGGVVHSRPQLGKGFRADGLIAETVIAVGIRRMVEILWYSVTARARYHRGQWLQPIQHKLLMPHPNECGPEKRI